MSRTTFENIVAEECWTSATQIEVLLSYVENLQSPGAFRDYLEGRRVEAVDLADDFMLSVADILQHPALTRNADFQEYCGNAYGVMTPEHAAESWWMRQFP